MVLTHYFTHREPRCAQHLSSVACASCCAQVEIEIETCDKGGTFLGSVVLPGAKSINLGLALARLGLAKTQPFFDPSRVKGGQELLAAIQAAKEQRLKVGSSCGVGIRIGDAKLSLCLPVCA